MRLDRHTDAGPMGLPGLGRGYVTATVRVSTIVTIVYLVVGVIIAADHHYFRDVDRIKEIAEAVLAVIAWPLLLLGVDLRF